MSGMMTPRFCIKPLYPLSLRPMTSRHNWSECVRTKLKAAVLATIVSLASQHSVAADEKKPTPAETPPSTTCVGKDLLSELDLLSDPR